MGLEKRIIQDKNHAPEIVYFSQVVWLVGINMRNKQDFSWVSLWDSDIATRKWNFCLCSTPSKDQDCKFVQLMQYNFWNRLTQ